MSKFTTESDAGRARASSYKGADVSVAEPTYPKAQRVDPSVCFEPLGEMTCGAVPMAVTTGKPQAYTAKKGAP